MTKTKLEKPEEIVKIFDNPDYIDRYEFVIDSNDYWEYDALCCSSNPGSLQGVSNFGQGKAIEGENRIDWNEIPKNVREHVISRLN